MSHATSQATLLKFRVPNGCIIANLEAEDVKRVQVMAAANQQLDLSHLDTEKRVKQMEAEIKKLDNEMKDDLEKGFQQ